MVVSHDLSYCDPDLDCGFFFYDPDCDFDFYLIQNHYSSLFSCSSLFAFFFLWILI